jgi:hypothetical protein
MLPLHIPSTSAKSMKSLASKHSPSFKKTTSFKSVRSARSLGLLSSPPGHNTAITPTSHNKSVVHFGEINENQTPSPTMTKKLSQKLSFSMKKSTPTVNSALKPRSPSPLKRKSVNGFQMLKEGAKLLRKGKDEFEQVWVEYQTADDGPIFYSVDGVEGGQWNRPEVFTVIHHHHHHNDDGSSVEDHSVEIVDNLSEGLLTIKTPVNKNQTSSKNNSMQSVLPKKDETNDKNKLTVSTTPIATNNNNNNNNNSSMISSSEDKFDVNQTAIDPIKLMSKSYVNLGINSIVRTASSQNLKSPQPIKEALQSPEGKKQTQAVLDIFIDPSPTATSTTNLKIKNIQQEAMLELQKLREKLNQAKKDFASNTNTPSRAATIAAATTAPAATSTTLATSSVPVPVPVPVAVSTFSPVKTIQPSPVVKEVPPLSPVKKNNAENGSVKSKKEVKNKPTPAPASAPTVLPPLDIHSKPLSNAFLESSGGISETSTLSASNSTHQPQQKGKSLDTAKAAPPPSSKEQPERKSVQMNNETYYWDEIVSRSHIIQRSLHWYCLYDTKLKLRFFKSKEGETCQLDKPGDFDSNIEVKSFCLFISFF